MKKIIALLLAVVMVLGLVACSSSADKTPDTTPAETTDNTPADTTDTETKTDDTAADDTAAAASGKVEQAQVALNAVAEQYPELKANENYKQLMTELALTENQIAYFRHYFTGPQPSAVTFEVQSAKDMEEFLRLMFGDRKGGGSK